MYRFFTKACHPVSRSVGKGDVAAWELQNFETCFSRGDDRGVLQKDQNIQLLSDLLKPSVREASYPRTWHKAALSLLSKGNKFHNFVVLWNALFSGHFQLVKESEQFDLTNWLKISISSHTLPIQWWISLKASQILEPCYSVFYVSCKKYTIWFFVLPIPLLPYFLY